jgi:hypothetical protein
MLPAEFESEATNIFAPLITRLSIEFPKFPKDRIKILKRIFFDRNLLVYVVTALFNKIYRKINLSAAHKSSIYEQLFCYRRE